jgi:hypothetical protein
MRAIAYVLCVSPFLACMAPGGQPPKAEPFDPKSPSILRADNNGVSVHVQYVSVDTVLLRHLGERAESNDEFLIVVFGIGISDSGRKVDYDGWASSSVSLTDNLGNSYKPINFGFGTAIDGQLKSATIYSDKPAQDRLVFQRPVRDADKLLLELPASNVGGSGTLRLRFDVPRPAPPKPPKPKEQAAKRIAPAPANPEQRAAQKLEFARALVSDKKYDRAKVRLKEVMTEFPDTKAAKQAKEVFDSLPK